MALSKANDDLMTSCKKLSFTQKATEQRLLDDISNPEGFHNDPLLIGVYSATLNEDEFVFEKTELDDENELDCDKGRSRKDIFLKSLEQKLDPNNAVHTERFKEVKNQILEKVKVTQLSRVRTRSSSSKKRGLSPDLVSHSVENSPIRQKTSQIPKLV